VETYFLRSGGGTTDLRKFSAKPVEFVRAVLRGSAYGLMANALGFALVCLPDAAFFPYGVVTRWRIIALVLYCAATSFAANAFWRHAAAMQGASRRIVRAGAVAIVAMPTAYGLSDPVILHWGHHPEGTNALGSFLLSVYGASTVVIAVAMVVRVAHQSWWLRLERWGWVGWPLVLAAIYPILVYAGWLVGLGLEQITRGRMDVFTFDSLRGFPLATGVPPALFRALWEDLRNFLWSGRRDLLPMSCLAALNAWPLVADFALIARAWWASRQMTRNSQRSTRNSSR
jgi:hypothetical protein